MSRRTLVRRATSTAALAMLAAIQAEAQQTLVGIVVARNTGLPVPYADVTLAGTDRAQFSDGSGIFRFRDVTPDDFQLRVRRLGFESRIVNGRMSEKMADTVRVELTEFAIQLGRIRVNETVCPGTGGSDTAVVAFLERLRLNAERSRLLTSRYPFAMTIERTVADEQPSAVVPSVRNRSHVNVDTIVAIGASSSDYAPGSLIVSRFDTEQSTTERFIIPQLADFGSAAFLAAHCFRYEGMEKMDGFEVARVSFEPITAYENVDPAGTLYLDAATFMIRKSVLRFGAPLASRESTSTRGRCRNRVRRTGSRTPGNRSNQLPSASATSR